MTQNAVTICARVGHTRITPRIGVSKSAQYLPPTSALQSLSTNAYPAAPITPTLIITPASVWHPTIATTTLMVIPHHKDAYQFAHSTITRICRLPICYACKFVRKVSMQMIAPKLACLNAHY